MNPGLIILCSILFVLYVFVRMVRPIPVRFSSFELKRRAKEGDAQALLMRERLQLMPLVLGLQRFIGIVILLVAAVALVKPLGLFGAVFVVLVATLVIEWIAGLKAVRRFGEVLYGRIEPSIERLGKHPAYFFFLTLPDVLTPDGRIDSEAELLHLVERATFLEPERRALIRSSLEFTGLTVADAMSGRRSIKSVDKGEVLGPLLLDELYKTGKQSFVVVDGTLDTVVGILKLDRLTSLDLKDTPTALAAMSAEVHFVDEDSPITDALGYLRSSKTPFLVVQDADGKTVGLLGMDNILRCLFEQ